MKPATKRKPIGKCSACGRSIAAGRGGKRCDGNLWHSACWNKAFEAWALGIVTMPHTVEIHTESDLPPGVPFSLSCRVCDCDSPDTWFAAVLKGWSQIEYDPDGVSWNFLGYCPEHVEDGVWEVEEPKKPKRKRGAK